jgi:hypothetical protein
LTAAEVRSWLARADKLSAAQARAGVDEPADLMRRLAELDALIRAAPPRIRGAYVRLRERDLTEAAELRAARLELDHTVWGNTGHDDPLETLRPVAVEARAVDTLLRRRRPKEVPRDPNRAWRVTPGPEVFVVPLTARADGRRGDNQPYERRGLVEHRILPCRLGRYAIRLVASGGVNRSDGARRPFRGGAALFDGLKLQLNGIAGATFTVQECRAADHDSQIDAHVTEGHAAGSTVLVWPELTMNLNDRERVRRQLANRLNSQLASRPVPDLVLPGSWHEPRRGGVVNRSVVFDGFGRVLTDFLKTEAFHTKAYGTEDIEEGTTITVLRLEDQLIGFGICKDFCQIHKGNPYPELDLDYYVIPSMGNAVTTEGHIVAARQVGGRYGARSFVVQQSDLDLEAAEQPGFVVPPSKDLSGFDAVLAHQSERFKLYEGD